MRVLHYKDLNLRRVRSAFDKVKTAIEAGDFRSADVKKLNAGPYYRAKLDYANRLLLQFARVDRSEGGSEVVCLALEVIENHRAHAVRTAGQTHCLRRSTGRGLSPSGAPGGDRLRGLGQDGGHAGAFARG